MEDSLLAVLVYEHHEPFGALGKTLTDLSVETYGVRTWEAARVLISQYQPMLVFVELSLWTKWREAILNTGQTAEARFNVIVVGSLPDIEQYVSTLEQGAFNFVTPPFSHETLSLAVHSAVVDVRRRRESVGRVTQSAF